MGILNSRDPEKKIRATEAHTGIAPLWGHTCGLVLNVNFYNLELPGKGISVEEFRSG